MKKYKILEDFQVYCGWVNTTQTIKENLELHAIYIISLELFYKSLKEKNIKEAADILKVLNSAKEALELKMEMVKILKEEEYDNDK